MGLLNRESKSQSRREREQLRRHLHELGELREEGLLDLGGIVVEMHRRDRIAGKLLWSKAAEIDAIDYEAKLVQRGIDEGLSLEQLEELARR